MVRQLESDLMAYEYMVARFRERGDLRMLRQLEAAPVTVADGTPDAYLSVRDRAMHRLGVGTMHPMHSVITGVFWPSQIRSTVGEKIRYGAASSQPASCHDGRQQILRSDMPEQLPKVDLPQYFLHGVHDNTCCLSLHGTC